MVRAAALAVLLAVLLATAPPALAFNPIATIVCAPAEEMTLRLRREHGSERMGQGVRSHDQVMELWSAKNGAWALVIAYASGQSCIVAMGEAWEASPVPVEADPA